MTFAGLDIHKKVIEAVIVDDNGAVLHQERFPATHDAITAFATRHCNKETRAALEATTNSWAIAGVLESGEDIPDAFKMLFAT
jgi:transposase